MMIDFYTVLNIMKLNSSSKYTYSCFPEVLLTTSMQNILPKPLAAFPNNQCQNS